MLSRSPTEKKNAEAEIVLPKPDPSHAYAELAVTTNFSFLRGASHPEDLVRQAAALGLAGIGIADRNSVAGVVRAYSAAEQLNAKIKELNDESKTDHPELKLVVGARLVFADGTPDILAYPQNRTAWGRLTRLLTVGKSRGEKAECILFIDDLLEHIAGLNLIVMPPDADQGRCSWRSSLARLKSAIVPATRLARRQHAVSRRRQPPARASDRRSPRRHSFR